jgi:hypothetical protein
MPNEDLSKITENPFNVKSDEELEEALSEETPDEKPAEEEESEDELFKSDDEEDSDNEDGLFDEEDEDGEESAEKKVVSQATFKRRLNKVIEQRDSAKDELKEVLEENASLHELNAKVMEKYKEFADPAAQVAWDADFVSFFEQNKNIPEIRAAAEAAVNFIKTGEIKVSQTTHQPQPREERTEDERVTAIIERDAKRTIVEALPDNVKPSFRNVLTDYILGTEDDLANLTSKDVMAAAKDFIKSREYDPSDVYSGEKGKPKKAEKPATGGKAKPAVKDKPAEKADEDRPAAPKSMDEWEANRASRIRGLFS